MPDPMPTSIAVVGAGITGLTAAYRLTQRGYRVRVFEAGDRIGGAIQTEISDEWLVEKGPNSLLLGDAAVLSLFADLELADTVIAASPAAGNRYIVRGGKPLPVPLSPPALFTSRLFSLRAKLRLLKELTRQPRPRSDDVSLAALVEDHFGQEWVDYALNPFVAGVYAGDPTKLSARHAFPSMWAAEQARGSLLRGHQTTAGTDGRKKHVVSFPRGLATLPLTLASRLPAGTLRLRSQVEALVPVKSGDHPPRGRVTHGQPKWNVTLTETGPLPESFDAIIVALPAPALALLRIGPDRERPLESLGAIDHPPVTSVFLGYRRSQVRHPLDGFGLLVPEVERRSILGVLFSSSSFPYRAPPDHVALTVLVGGTRQPEIARLPIDRLLSVIEPDLHSLLGVTGSPVFRRHAFWPRAIPQYNLGYQSHLERMSAVEAEYRGVFFGGQARDGISLPSCIAAGDRLANQFA